MGETRPRNELPQAYGLASEGWTAKGEVLRASSSSQAVLCCWNLVTVKLDEEVLELNH